MAMSYIKEHIKYITQDTCMIHCDKVISFQSAKLSLNITFRLGRSSNPYPADHDYFRLQFVLYVDQIADTGNKMCA